MRPSLSLLLLLPFTFALGCAGPSEEDAAGSDDALTVGAIGGRWRTKLEPGIYDAEGVTLHVWNVLEHQNAALLERQAFFMVTTCEGTLDIINDEVVLNDDYHGCKDLKLSSVKGGGVAVRGRRGNAGTTELKRRSMEGFVGTFRSERTAPTTTLVVESSSETTLRVSVEVDGTPVASHVTATLETHFTDTNHYWSAFKMPSDACPLNLFPVPVESGGYGLRVDFAAFPAPANACVLSTKTAGLVLKTSK